MSVCIISKCWFVAWFVGDQLLLRDFGSYGIVFMNAYVVITVAIVNDVKGFRALWNNIYD
jgi:hypothetical protein